GRLERRFEMTFEQRVRRVTIAPSEKGRARVRVGDSVQVKPVALLLPRVGRQRHEAAAQRVEAAPLDLVPERVERAERFEHVRTLVPLAPQRREQNAFAPCVPQRLLYLRQEDGV